MDILGGFEKTMQNWESSNVSDGLFTAEVEVKFLVHIFGRSALKLVAGTVGFRGKTYKT